MSVRTAGSYPAVISRANTWLEMLWPEARGLGITRRSTAGHIRPDIEAVDIFGCGTSASFDGHLIRVATAEHLRKTLARHYVGASPVLDGLSPAPMRDYARACILHEAQHVFDLVDGRPWRDQHRHDRHWFLRLAKLENRFDPRGA